MRPADLCRLLNSTPLGQVLNDRQLYRHRLRADHRFSVGRNVDLSRYVAWLVLERHASAPRRERHGTQRAICWRDLLQMLQAQAYRCSLSGRVLTPANAALDHILPVSRGGHHVIENVQILDKQVNRAKATMTNEEFVAMCREVVAWADAHTGSNA